VTSFLLYDFIHSIYTSAAVILVPSPKLRSKAKLFQLSSV